MAPALTALAIERIKPTEARFEVPDGKIIGLRLVVQPSGHKSWCARYTIRDRDRRFTLGSFPLVGLEQARKLASAALRSVAEGNDPAAARAEARRRAQAGLDQEILFGAAFERYLAEHVKTKLKRTTAYECERLFKSLILPKFRRRKLSEITPIDVKSLTSAQIKRGVPITGSKVFTALRGLFNWCRRELLITTPNPCDGLEMPEGAKPRERVLDEEEIALVWQAAGKLGHPFGPMIRLLLLTAARRDEARSAVESEFDWEKRLWTLPAERVKNDREHAIYLSDASLAVLESIPRIEGRRGYLFTTNGETPVSGFSRAKRRLDTIMKEIAGKPIPAWRVHDLRRTAASGMAKLGIQLPVIERALNHISGSFAGIVGVYQKHKFMEEREAAFAAWSNHVMTLVGQSTATNIVPMRLRKRSRAVRVTD